MCTFKVLLVTKKVFDKSVQGLALDEVHIKVIRENDLLSRLEGRQSTVGASSAAESVSKWARAARRIDSRVFKHRKGDLRARVSFSLSASTGAVLAGLLRRTNFAIINQSRLRKISSAQEGRLINQLFISSRFRVPGISDGLLLELNGLGGASRVVGLLRSNLNGVQVAKESKS